MKSSRSVTRSLLGAAVAVTTISGCSLLGDPVPLANGDGTLLTGTLSVATQPWLADHRIGDHCIYPGVGYGG